VLPEIIGTLVSKISEGTGLDERRVRLLAIGFVVILLVLLVAKCLG
jgi:hypothetical protein